MIIWKVATCQRITSKKHSNPVGRYLSPRYDQTTLVSGYTVLTAVNWSKHGCSNIRLQAPKLARKCEIKHWYACGADGRKVGWSVYGHVIAKCSRIDSYGAPLKIQNWARDQIKYQRNIQKNTWPQWVEKMSPWYSQVMVVSGCSSWTAVN